MGPTDNMPPLANKVEEKYRWCYFFNFGKKNLKRVTLLWIILKEIEQRKANKDS